MEATEAGALLLRQALALAHLSPEELTGILLPTMFSEGTPATMKCARSQVAEPPALRSSATRDRFGRPGTEGPILTVA